ncbi:hypothetical protein M433DRAFT_63383 [Acidomyces richmondensis BFW]|nr:MAG: hypothetical protein FE78DRAFT_29410 [Acidomyces sp. 'richmondensis']KYG47284.1 hypothetical protein M433DRAFT_63383 [Acidomyces richmondensis BFW]
MPNITPDRLVELDGRTLEGGGQLLRIALGLSALTNIPIRISHIRGNRGGGGGLKAQHLACVKWLAMACNAKVEGAEKGSTTLFFKPGARNGRREEWFTMKGSDGQDFYIVKPVEIGGVGSTGLAMQAVLPFVLFGGSIPRDRPLRIVFSGGTNVSGSPSFEYVSQVLLPTLRRMGVGGIEVRLGRRGWSHGGSTIGYFTLEIAPREASLPAFVLAPGDAMGRMAFPPRPTKMRATFLAPPSCHEHFRPSLFHALKHEFDFTYTPGGSLHVSCEDSGHERRMYFLLVATVPTASTAISSPSNYPQVSSTPDPPNAHSSPDSYILGRDWLYDRKIRSHAEAARNMAECVTRDLAREWRSGTWVDEHMRDQLVIFQALADGVSEIFQGRTVTGEERETDERSRLLREPSLHCRTAEWVATKILGVRFGEDGTCEGVGFGKKVRVDVVDRIT